MFKRFGGDIQNKLVDYEKNLNIHLPGDYIEFLVSTNGGQFINEVHTFWVNELKQDIGIDVLFGFEHARSLCLTSWYEEYYDELPEKTIIIGNSINAGLIVLIWQVDWKGIFLWDHCLELEQSTEEDCLYRVADDFGLFYDMIEVPKR